MDDIRKLKGAHESRNPLIARVLREIGYVREMGEGIHRIFDVMRTNALAEPDIQSNNDNFVVTLFHRSLYDPRVKLWLTLFEDFKLTENQTAVLALGFEGKEFSTQDIIDRLGIVDTDQVRQILTPLRNLGIVDRTKNDAEAYATSKARKIPKRSVPMFKVIGNPSDIRSKEKLEAEEYDSENVEISNELNIYICNIFYKSKKEDLIDMLENYCSLLSIDLPKNEKSEGANRGFAYATVQPISGTCKELLSSLQGVKLAGRLLSVRIRR